MDGRRQDAISKPQKEHKRRGEEVRTCVVGLVFGVALDFDVAGREMESLMAKLFLPQMTSFIGTTRDVTLFRSGRGECEWDDCHKHYYHRHSLI